MLCGTAEVLNLFDTHLWTDKGYGYAGKEIWSNV